MAHKKGEGSVKNGRDSHSKRLGVKIYGGCDSTVILNLTVNPQLLVTLLSGNVVLFTILAKMLVLEKILHCSL